MIDLEKAENGCLIGLTMPGKRFKETQYIATKGSTLQALQIIWKGMNEPSDDILSVIVKRKQLSVQIWKERPDLAQEREMEAPGMTIYECVRIVARNSIS